MNIFEKQPQQEFLDNFRKEIENLKEEEIKKRGEKSNRDLIDTGVGKLTQDDMKVWQMLKELNIDTVTEEDEKYFKEHSNLVDVKQDPSRRSFASFMNNSLGVLWMKKQLRDFKEEKE